MVGVLMLVATNPWAVYAQSSPADPSEFLQVEGAHIRLITDLPHEAEAHELVQCFDLAVEHWRNRFQVPPSQVGQWKCTACIMLERQRFEQAGLISTSIPEFPYGFQYGDQLWVSEQPSAYYRRHLLLHEGTHWFMWRKYGTVGPPWLMEGMAEWLATHRWDPRGPTLDLGIIPHTKNEVPYWGRVKLIQDQLVDGQAPSLETVLRYDTSAHRRVEAYAWSWAAVLFFAHHPQTRGAFERLLRDELPPGTASTRQLFRQLQPRWPELRAAWSAWVTELDYGADLSRMAISLAPCPPLTTAQRTTIDAAGGWQSAGCCVAAETMVEIVAEGQFTLADAPRPWWATPDGVTLEYYRGQPLGKLLLVVLGPIDQEPAVTERLRIIPVGGRATVKLERGGELFFRLNEATGDLSDNRGTITIDIRPL
ncbi:MAG: hypothetical protein KatS3mg111_4190 [Pirellulaceae bacterium]|nr:MAG: hypothetical protein KatS3mg111_4190 [Pirellulaceae bacterium]